MNPDDIKLEDINKMLVYEQQVRLIDKLDEKEAKNFAKAYCKLFLQQQEVVSNLAKNF
jgi:hypothetical protein